MFQKVGNLLLVIAMLGAVGMQWTLLQTVAWTAMLASNLRTGSLCSAIERTFDGQHPCCLCKRIAAGKKSQKTAEFSKPLSRLEFISERAVFEFLAPGDFRLLPGSSFAFRDIRSQPPTPPPRALAA